ncbi:hypothetical protein ACEWY4_019795 [Coilia grayii]|uniref:SNTX thioredoxin-like domain-containing protein n=1 Tax=Coilia grayii TaxID=363190 RepID=A0ABD1JAR8_9TELE
MQRNTVVCPLPYTKFECSASESLSEKMSLLDVSASLKASFFCGLVEVGGSAKFLNQKTSSTHQCSVTLKYHVTTEFRELIMSELETPKPEDIDKTDATHIVSQVTYGAHALMEFQESASEETRKRDIQQKLSTMVHMIPVIGINGDGSLNMNEDDKTKVQNFRCHFFGDFQTKTLPMTFQEAVAVCKELPYLLGEKGEKAVPVTVWLYPLSKLTNTEGKLKRMLSDMLVEKFQRAMDDLHQAEIRANDLLEKSKAIKAEDIVGKLESFQSSLQVFIPEFLRKMADLIPAIRGGDVVDKALRDLLDSQNASGFSRAEMRHWLDGKDTEIHVLTSHIKKLQCDIKPQGSELDCFLMDPDVFDAYVFSFTSLSYLEPYLQKISQAVENLQPLTPNPNPNPNPELQHLTPNPIPNPNLQHLTPNPNPNLQHLTPNLQHLTPNPNLQSRCSSSAEQDEEEAAWYHRPDVKRALRSSVDVFNSIVLENKKAISFIPDPKNPGASVRWYHDAALEDPHVTEAPQDSQGKG